MTLLTVGTDGAITRALNDAAPLGHVDAATTAILAERPDQIAIIGLSAPAGPIGRPSRWPSALPRPQHSLSTLCASPLSVLRTRSILITLMEHGP